MHWPDTLAPKPPRRRYPFWARRDRRRAAQAMAGGRTPEQVALVNRVSVLEVETLLRDEEFQELLRHYEAIAGLSYEERLARLAALALDILEMGLETGDMRVAMFVLHARNGGCDPARRLALHAMRRIEAEAAGARPVRAAATPKPGRPRTPPSEWRQCAAVQVEAEDAERLALAELRDVERTNRAAMTKLADRLMGEAERIGTALDGLTSPAMRLEATARGVARYYHDRPAESLAATERLQAARRLGSFAPSTRPTSRSTGPPD